MIKVLPTLYKIDSKGKLREWHLEVQDNSYRSVAGLADGQKVISEWKRAYAKNTGKSNATTDAEQALAEAEALYTKRLEGEYRRSVAELSQGLTFVKPMLADKWEDRKDRIEYPVYVQPKLDGIRCIASRAGLYTRAGKQILATPHILEALAPLFAADPDLILDGELYNHDLKDDFNKIVSLVRKTKPTPSDVAESATTVQYHVYDVPSLNTSFEDRMAHYNTLLVGLNHPAVVPVATSTAHNEDQVDEFYSECMGQGYEGGMVRVNSIYENKRSRNLLKRKDFQDEEFTIIRIEEGQGNWSSYAKRVFFQLEDGRHSVATLKGNQEYCAQVLADAHKYVGGQVTVQYFARTPDGMPRFPIAKAIFPGKRDL